MSIRLLLVDIAASPFPSLPRGLARNGGRHCGENRFVTLNRGKHGPGRAARYKPSTFKTKRLQVSPLWPRLRSALRHPSGRAY